MIDKNRIKANVEQFSIPRLSGSESEEDSFNALREKISKLNIEHSTQNFSFSSFYSRIYPKISLGLLFVMLFIQILRFHGFYPRIFILICFIILIIIMVFTRNPEKIKLGKVFHSQNVFVKLGCNKSTNDNDDAHLFNATSSNIFLFSHLDSKGQRFTIKVRVMSVWLWIISFLAGLTLNMIHIIFLNDSLLIIQITEIFLLSLNF